MLFWCNNICIYYGGDYDMSCMCGCHDILAPRNHIGKCMNCGCVRLK